MTQIADSESNSKFSVPTKQELKAECGLRIIDEVTWTLAGSINVVILFKVNKGYAIEMEIKF